MAAVAVGGKSVTHAFRPPDPEGTCPGRDAPSAQETDPPLHKQGQTDKREELAFNEKQMKT